MAPTTTDHPDVSVVILSWRLAGTLQDCVQAVLDQQTASTFEVVVVVNGGSDDVVRAAHESGAHRVVVAATNLGFGGGCDLGIRSSSSPYAVLLNDDAVVRPGWLDSLVTTVGTTERVGAVASLLLNSDGTVQEAGSRVLPSGGTRQWGRGLTIDQARADGLLKVRPIDYGSAAALLLRRAAYDEVGGFDPRYEPAYYEDVDLQFRIRCAGWKILFEPEALAVHTSGGSTSDLDVYREFLGNRSGKLFIDRWSDALGHSTDSDDVATLTPVEVFPPSGHDAAEPPRADLDLVHPRVLAEYVEWLVTTHRVSRAETTSLHADIDRLQSELSALHEQHQDLRAELDRLYEDHRALQSEHHETSQVAHGLKLELDDIRAHPMRHIGGHLLPHKKEGA